MSLKCIDFLNVIKSIIVNDCFVICVGSSLLSKTVDLTISKEHCVNPIGSMLVPVTVTMKGHLSSVSFNFKDSKVLRLMQLFVAPVSYKALILMSELLIGKTVPVVGPTAIVQISTKCLSVLCTSL